MEKIRYRNPTKEELSSFFGDPTMKIQDSLFGVIEYKRQDAWMSSRHVAVKHRKG